MIKKSVKVFFALSLAMLLFASLFSCVGDDERVNAVTSVKYSEKADKLKISATLDRETAKAYKRETIYLMEIPAHNSIDDIVTLIPAAQAKAGKKMSFEIPLKNGAKTCLYSGFALAIFDKTEGYVALGDVRYVENPEALASNEEEYPVFSSAKGLYISSLSDAAELGVRHTVIRIPVEDYISIGDVDGEIACSFDGNTFYINKNKIAELDYKVKNLTDAGIEVFFEFTLDTSPDALPNKLSFLPLKQKKTEMGGIAGAVGSGNNASFNEQGSSLSAPNVHYAISMKSGESYQHLAAFFEFFAERYTREDGKYGFAAAYIIGQGVNSLGTTNSDDARTLADTTDSYARLLRLAATALRSKYANGRVYTSLNNVWNCSDSEGISVAQKDTGISTQAETLGEEAGESISAHVQGGDNLPKPLRTEFGGSEYLTALVKNIAKAGSFDFGVALIPNASDINSSSVWMDEKAVNAQTTVNLTVKNLSVLSEFLSRESMLLDGKERDIILYNYQISASTPDAMAASYAYAYYKATEAGADAIIYNGQWDNATGNGSTGLWQMDSAGEPFEPRAIYTVFKNIDVKGMGETEQAKARIGAEWSALYSKYSKKVQTALVSTGSAVNTPDTKALAKLSDKILYDFSEGYNYGFYPSDSAIYVEVADDASGGKVLRAALSPRYKGEKVGIRSGDIDYETLSSAKIITVALCAKIPDSNTSRITLALSQSNDKGSSFFSSVATVQASNWQTVYFNLDSIKLDKDFGPVKMNLWLEADGIPIRLDGNEPLGNGGEAAEISTGYELDIKSISVASKKKGISVIAIILVIIILVVLGFVAYKFFGGNRPNKQRAGRGGYPRPQNRPVGAPPRMAGAGGRPMSPRGENRPMGRTGQKPQGATRPTGHVGNRPMRNYPTGQATGQGRGHIANNPYDSYRTR